MLEHYAEFMRPVSVIRYDKGTYVEGEWTPGKDGEEKTQMIVLPVTAASIKIMAQGSYVAGDKRFYDAGAIVRYQQKDIITLEDVRYEIRDIQDRTFEGNFTIYFAKRIVKESKDA